jgi:hypothetical protein
METLPLCFGDNFSMTLKSANVIPIGAGGITESGVWAVEEKRRIWLICCRQTMNQPEEIRHYGQG